MFPLLIAGGVAALASGLGNYLANSSASDRALALQNQGLQQWIAAQIPDPKEQQVAFQMFVNQGQLHPALQQAIEQNPSEFQKIVVNPSYQAAQNNALSQLEQIGNQGGLRLQDKEALQDAMLNSQAQSRGNRDAIVAQAARQGLTGSGVELAARLADQQGTADRNAQNSLQVASGAQQRALQAIEDSGSMATQFRNEQFGEQAQKAQAADRINQFNVQNLRDVNAANVGTQNAAQMYNLNRAQDISNQNTQLANQQQVYNKQLLQQQYENQLKKAAGETGQYGQMANTAQQQGQNLGNTISNVGGAVSGALSSQANYQQQMDLLDKYLAKK